MSTVLRLSPELLATLRDRARQPDAPRVEPVDLAGRRYWIKRRERLSWRWRLQKGNPERLFAREKAAHHALLDRGAPVPPIVDEGADYMVLPDCGPTLEMLITGPESPGRLAAFAAAGTAMARLHAMGLSHGRPHLRDLCWTGREVVFLDFERGARPGASLRRRAWDLIQLVYGVYCLALFESPEVEAVCAAYRAADTAGVWPAAERLARQLRWLEPVTRPLQRRDARRKPHKRFQEFRSIPLTLARFGAR